MVSQTKLINIKKKSFIILRIICGYLQEILILIDYSKS